MPLHSKQLFEWTVRVKNVFLLKLYFYFILFWKQLNAKHLRKSKKKAHGV